MVKQIQSKQEFDNIINSGKVVLIDYYADWCGPCKQISPVFEQHEEEHKGKGVEFYKLNVDDLPDVAEECGIRSMPTFRAYKNGEQIHQLIGANRVELQILVAKGLEKL